MDTPDENAPEYSGPYSAEDNGTCAAGHPLNAYGRCEPLNDLYRQEIIND